MSSEVYNGPESNDVYENETPFETFDNWEDEEGEEVESQDISGSDVDDDGFSEGESKKSSKKSSKKDEGELEILDTIEEEDPKKKETPKEKPSKKDEDEVEETEETKEKIEVPKGKQLTVTIGEENFALPNDALVTVSVDGKKEKVPLSELTRQYSGQQAWDKRFNELNVKNQEVQRKYQEVEQTTQYIGQLKEQIMEIVQDPQQNPKEAFRIFLDAIGVDSYDLEERQFSHDLEELYNVLTMSDDARRAYMLEKKNKYLSERQTRKEEEFRKAERTNSYRQKVAQLRQSYGVSETEYVEAYEELKSFGIEAKDITAQEIVEWSATKPHRKSIREALEPYADQMNDDVYSDLTWKLSKALLERRDTLENIKKNLEQVYGKHNEVADIRSKLKTVGRPKAQPKQQTKTKYEYESFDDWDD